MVCRKEMVKILPWNMVQHCATELHAVDQIATLNAKVIISSAPHCVVCPFNNWKVSLHWVLTSSIQGEHRE